MPGPELEAADGSGRISLPEGETVIGRGPFLGIADKRVSRNHGVLAVEGEKIRIKSVHVNPCFYQPSDKKHFLPLEKNKWQWLREGDSFSLLPDKFVFKVICPHSDMDSTLSNSQILDEEAEVKTPESLSEVNEIRNVVDEEPSCSTNTILEKTQLGSGGTAQTTDVKRPFKSLSHFSNWSEESHQTKSIQRKRVLPAWMLGEGLDVKPLSTSPAKPAAKRSKGKVGQNSSGECPQGRKHLPPEEDSERSNECVPDLEKKSRIKTEQDIHARAQKAATTARVSRDLGHLGANKGNDGLQPMETPEEDEDRRPRDEEPEYRQTSKAQPRSQTSRRKGSDTEGEGPLDKSPPAQMNEVPQLQMSLSEVQEKDTSGIVENETTGSASNEDASQGSVQTTRKRMPCAYGRQCYRKNPIHFQECSHPGDIDFQDAIETSQDDNDDRPECPYGTDCYRKNPQHKLEYKHTKPPETDLGRPRRKTTKKGKSVLDDDSDDDGEPNAYDLNDSFLDDEEEEYEPTDEDSDYEPDSEEKEMDDVDTLLKEANAFVKTKK